MTTVFDWPDGVPYSPLVGTWNAQPQNNELEAPADVGEGDIRSRSTASSFIASFALMMTKSQLAALRYFYKSVVRGRVYMFMFKNPETDATQQFRFYEPIAAQHIAADYYRVSISIISRAE